MPKKSDDFFIFSITLQKSTSYKKKNYHFCTLPKNFPNSLKNGPKRFVRTIDLHSFSCPYVGPFVRNFPPNFNYYFITQLLRFVSHASISGYLVFFWVWKAWKSDPDIRACNYVYIYLHANKIHLFSFFPLILLCKCVRIYRVCHGYLRTIWRGVFF